MRVSLLLLVLTLLATNCTAVKAGETKTHSDWENDALMQTTSQEEAPFHLLSKEEIDKLDDAGVTAYYKRWKQWSNSQLNLSKQPGSSSPQYNLLATPQPDQNNRKTQDSVTQAAINASAKSKDQFCPGSWLVNKMYTGFRNTAKLGTAAAKTAASATTAATGVVLQAAGNAVASQTNSYAAANTNLSMDPYYPPGNPVYYPTQPRSIPNRGEGLVRLGSRLFGAFGGLGAAEGVNDYWLQRDCPSCYQAKLRERELFEQQQTLDSIASNLRSINSNLRNADMRGRSYNYNLENTNAEIRSLNNFLRYGY